MDAAQTGPDDFLDAPSVEQSIDEAIVRHYGQWILMKITGFDEYHEPVKGLVLAHSDSRDEMSRVLALQPPRPSGPPEPPYAPYYTFKAFKRTRPGESVEDAARRYDRLQESMKAGQRGG